MNSFSSYICFLCKSFFSSEVSVNESQSFFFSLVCYLDGPYPESIKIDSLLNYSQIIFTNIWNWIYNQVSVYVEINYTFTVLKTTSDFFTLIWLFWICCVTTGAYIICDLQALSHGSYLGTVTCCSFISVLLLSFKACVFTINSQFEQESSASLSRKRPHLKKSWGMPVLFLSSVVFALGHIVVAYHTSCKARRKLMFHRGDLEAVSTSNNFSLLCNLLIVFLYNRR